ncbi:hypothetical protein WN944_016004 [Citrus x changshan-huyou]|uniref:Signal recognition particle 14 kDa protein n=1 Tax=Citrus x changshan-huyou TaxID=2935761 RepID=A0AAP0MEZ9_9ROSI
MWKFLLVLVFWFLEYHTRLDREVVLDVLTMVGAKDHQRFQASYATLLKAHMAALKKRERKDKKKGVDGDRKDGTGSTKKPKRV